MQNDIVVGKGLKDPTLKDKKYFLRLSLEINPGEYIDTIEHLVFIASCVVFVLPQKPQ